MEAVRGVLRQRAALDDVLEPLTAKERLEPRDAALARAIGTVTFRRWGTIRHALATRIAKGLPSDEWLVALIATGAAQILFLDVPDHAAVDLSVRLARGGHHLQHAAGMVNAVLRRLGRERDSVLAEADALRIDTPVWLAARWVAAYGEERAGAIASAHAEGASVDITAKEDPRGWADRLGGIVLPTGSVRLLDRTPVRELPGYAEGAWWVQDAAAALPARILGARAGERVADLCAAPGGKTAQLAADGARVLAVDKSANRLRRLQENMTRLRLTVEVRAADVVDLDDDPFDAVLLDAPCSATGTLRRHPEIAWTKQESDVLKLADVQRRLLDKSATLVRNGGRLVFCTCSLEPEEGEGQIDAFLARHPTFRRVPVEAHEIGELSGFVNERGDVRTLPCGFESLGRGRSGLDGFYIARLVRRDD
jgi:16S rRNA (cytosine967-C5)-methyltransferase